MKIKIKRMMKKLFYKSVSLSFLILFFIASSVAAEEVTKEYHKEYKADASTTLDLSNKYGDVVITGWDKNQVVIDVKVTVEVQGQDRAQKLLDMIDVKFEEGKNLISAETTIDNKFNYSIWSGQKKFRIDYTVKMPYVTNLTLDNRYGNSDIDELRALVNLDIKYGNINIEKLTRGNEKPFNKLSLSYGKGTIGEAGWLDIYVRYSGILEIDNSQALLIDSRNSKLRIGETSSVVGEAKYDSYGIDKINNLVLSSGYTTVNINSLAKKLEYEGSYGSLSVDDIPAGFELLDVDVRYSGVRLGIAGSASYKLEGESSYGGIKLDEDNFNYRKRIVENNSSEMSGIVGKEESPQSTVKISTSYGTVKLY
jgi:hypothetical protein